MAPTWLGLDEGSARTATELSAVDGGLRFYLGVDLQRRRRGEEKGDTGDEEKAKTGVYQITSGEEG